MSAVTVGFSIPEEDLPRLDHLVETFARGNRSAFLRLAIQHMEVLDRAQRLRDLQSYGVQRRAEAGIETVPVEEIVHRVLSKNR